MATARQPNRIVTAIDPRVTVAVSTEMSQLRTTQALLNRFLWSTELSYGYMLSDATKVFPDMDAPVSDVLKHIETGAWILNNQGRIKLPPRTSIGQVLEQVNENTIHIYRAVLVYFGSAFENYLEERIGSNRNPSAKGWGPYVCSLSTDQLCDAPTPLKLKTMLCADISRLIRNQVVHPPFDLPLSLEDAIVSKWQNALLRHVQNTAWAHQSNLADIKDACAQVIGQAINHVKEAKTSGRNLPVEYFYMLFSLTNLDSLAFEIEEALVPAFRNIESLPEGRAGRKKTGVRRQDLIVGHSIDHTRPI